MYLQIEWSEFAEKQLDGIFEYYLENASNKVAKRIIQNIITAPDQLKNNPFIGQKLEEVNRFKCYFLILKAPNSLSKTIKSAGNSSVKIPFSIS